MCVGRVVVEKLTNRTSIGLVKSKKKVSNFSQKGSNDNVQHHFIIYCKTVNLQNCPIKKLSAPVRLSP
jgi:hypothetical protein